jgi:hypothetical protein
MSLAVALDAARAADTTVVATTLTGTSSVTTGDGSTTESPSLIFKGKNLNLTQRGTPGAVFQYSENQNDLADLGLSAQTGEGSPSALFQTLNRPYGRWIWGIAKSATTTNNTSTSRVQMTLDQNNRLSLYSPTAPNDINFPTNTFGDVAFALISKGNPQFALLGPDRYTGTRTDVGSPGVSLSYTDINTAFSPGCGSGIWLLNRSNVLSPTTTSWRWMIADPSEVIDPMTQSSSIVMRTRSQMALHADNNMFLYPADSENASIIFKPGTKDPLVPASIFVNGSPIPLSGSTHILSSGSALAPSLTSSIDRNTGIFFPLTSTGAQTNKVAVTTGGALQATFAMGSFDVVGKVTATGDRDGVAGTFNGNITAKDGAFSGNVKVAGVIRVEKQGDIEMGEFNYEPAQ